METVMEIVKVIAVLLIFSQAWLVLLMAGSRFENAKYRRLEDRRKKRNRLKYVRNYYKKQ